jgi:hypothetical protein
MYTAEQWQAKCDAAKLRILDHLNTELQGVRKTTLFKCHPGFQYREFDNLLYELKRDGMVLEDIPKGKTYGSYKITEKGSEYYVRQG